ncbi:MAG TPA: hypothetical protein VFC68_00380 [Treponemataceae bacterium]|nr:hypothetical protein [Treponemataceae bacterium]
MSKVSSSKKNKKFIPVGLEEFYTPTELARMLRGSTTSLVVLSVREQKIVNFMFDRLKTVAPDVLVVLADKIADLERLTANIAHFPSLLQTQVIDKEVRTHKSLVESLLTHRAGDAMLRLPSKAILGKGFLVAKFHAFATMATIAADWSFSEDFVAEVRSASIGILFSIMVEDVYLSLIENTNIPVVIRQKIAGELILLWEHRSDTNAIEMAPVLENIWHARRKLAPAFGTMVGTSELLLLSVEMDENWYQFIISELDKSDVTQSMEELLFGSSYEEIKFLKNIIKEQKGKAIGRKEAAKILCKSSNDFIFADEEDGRFDPRDLYANYSIRRDNARARRRLILEGPHYTIEDHYMQFVLQKKLEEQNNG